MLTTISLTCRNRYKRRKIMKTKTILLITALLLLCSSSFALEEAEFVENYDLLISYTKENLDTIKFDTKVIVDYTTCARKTVTMTATRIVQPDDILLFKSMLECPNELESLTNMVKKLNNSNMNVGTQWAYIRFKFVRDNEKVSLKVDKILQLAIMSFRAQLLSLKNK